MENTVSVVIVQQYLDRWMRIRCRGNSFTEQLTSESPVVVDEFNDRYLETAVCLSAYCIETSVLAVGYVVSARQRYRMSQ
jgi:electron transfer flavoprotein alpha/beta subunit